MQVGSDRCRASRRDGYEEGERGGEGTSLENLLRQIEGGKAGEGAEARWNRSTTLKGHAQLI